MENIDSKFVKDVWKKKGSKLKAPKIFFAVYSSKVYYVYRDDSFIIFTSYTLKCLFSVFLCMFPFI